MSHKPTNSTSMQQIGICSLRCQPLRLLILCVSLCASHTAVAASTLTAATVNYPLQYFAQRIGEDHIEVLFPVPADFDPSSWRPSAETILKYQRADLIVLNGAGYAKWVDKTSLPRLRLLDTSAGFRARYIKHSELITHSHGPSGEHAHEDTASITWLDFELATQQARAIADALSRKRPEFSETFQANYAELKKDLLSLDSEVKKIVSNKRERALLASYPAYDYFARGYGLSIVSVHWEPDEPVNETQWAELLKLLQNHAANWMIWEDRPLPESVARLNSIGIESLVFNPCANVPPEGDFLTVMQQNVESLRATFE